MPLSADDLTELERGGRRCAFCRSGRHWREFEVVRPEGHAPLVVCPACRARYGDALPDRGPVEAAPAAVVEAPAPKAAARPEPHEDRLKKTLRDLPRGEHTTGRIAKAAGMSYEKALARLQQLEAAGEVRQVGKRWSTEAPASDLEGAFDRLQARTSNLRIVRDRAPVG